MSPGPACHSTLQPVDYVVPVFPSLYWPIPIYGDQSYFLYGATEIWKFTMIWTVIFFLAMHLGVAGYACLLQWRNWKIMGFVVVGYAIFGGLEGFLGGSVVGGLLGATYNAGCFRMSTWVPFVWALINCMVVILSSYVIESGI